jgi:hypothetical protein
MSAQLRKVKVTWIRDGKLGKPLITHPYMYPVTDDEGVLRYFDTLAEVAEHYATPAAIAAEANARLAAKS